MSDSENRPDPEKLIEDNPMVDRDQLEEASEAVDRLRRAGLTRPSYRIESPYERGPVEQPRSDIEDGEAGTFSHLR